MILLDTGYLVALFHPRDEHHDCARRWSTVLDEKSDERLIVTEYVLWECVNFFSKPRNRAKAHALVDFVRGNADYELIPAGLQLLEGALSLHRQRKDKAWSLTDCASFIVMHDRDMTQALSHDHDFEEAGFEALLRRDP